MGIGSVLTGPDPRAAGVVHGVCATHLKPIQSSLCSKRPPSAPASLPEAFRASQRRLAVGLEMRRQHRGPWAWGHAKPTASRRSGAASTPPGMPGFPVTGASWRGNLPQIGTIPARNGARPGQKIVKIVVVKPPGVPYLFPKCTGFGARVNRFYPKNA